VSLSSFFLSSLMFQGGGTATAGVHRGAMAYTTLNGLAGEDMHSRGLSWTPTQPLLTTVDATATGVGALCEPSQNIPPTGSSMTRTQALLGDPNHFALNGLGTCAWSVNREAVFILMHVRSASARKVGVLVRFRAVPS
jgi:hypothetical protein